MTNCLAPDCQMGGLGCDNMTVILVCLLQGGTYDDLAVKCSRPAKSSPVASEVEIYPGENNSVHTDSLSSAQISNLESTQPSVSDNSIDPPD